VTVPERIAWAVERLHLQPTDEVLEVGCGTGVAVALVADRLAGGRITAIDRSAVAIRRTSERVAGHVAAGRVVLQRCELAAFEAAAASVDTAFAVNVNVFWTSDARAECAVLRRALRPGGSVHLVYDGPGPAGARDVVPAVVAALEREGFAASVERSGTGGMVCVTGRREDG
jgi:cyclopropane fatty-acyl-phospholipid synthase-like methyltransferase